MTVDSNALSLSSYALLSNDPLVQAVTMSLIDSGSILQDVPFITRKAMKVDGARWEGSLPTVNWAAINGEPTVTTGAPTRWQEQVFVLRNAIDTDKLLVEDMLQITDPRGAVLDAYMKGAAYDLNDKFINNDHVGGDANAYVGLKYRIDNGTSYGVRSGNKVDGAGVVVTTAATAANANSFFEKLDELLWRVDAPDGTNVTMYMNEAMQRRMWFLARLMSGSGGFSQSTDQLGRTFTQYRGATIRDIGYKSDQSTRIITVTENADGTAGSSNYTSIYAVNYSAGHFGGWQFDVLAARDLGLLNNGVTYRTVVDWAGGFMNSSNRSIARLYDVKYS